MACGFSISVLRENAELSPPLPDSSNRKSLVIFTSSQPESQSLFFSQDSIDLKSRASVAVPGFRTARRVTSRR
jgi:hypothetical protein